MLIYSLTVTGMSVCLVLFGLFCLPDLESFFFVDDDDLFSLGLSLGGEGKGGKNMHVIQVPRL